MTPKDEYHLLVLANTPAQNIQQAVWKAEITLELVQQIKEREDGDTGTERKDTP